jgi:hypothetical protein
MAVNNFHVIVEDVKLSRKASLGQKGVAVVLKKKVDFRPKKIVLDVDIFS